MQESVQIKKLNRGSSHDKGGTLRGCAHCLGMAWPGLTRGDAILTAFEVALYYVEDDLGTSVTIPTLLVMMVVKFAVVGAYFMHLKFDSPIFRRLFYAGILLAVGVYVATMTSMQFFGDDTTSVDQRVDNSSNSPVESR